MGHDSTGPETETLALEQDSTHYLHQITPLQYTNDSKPGLAQNEADHASKKFLPLSPTISDCSFSGKHFVQEQTP